MPTYIRPARVDITEGGGGVLVLAAAAFAAGALVAFVLAHLILIAVAAVVLAAAPLALAMAMRRLIQPRGIRRWHREQELSARLAQPGGVVQVPGLVRAAPRCRCRTTAAGCATRR
jgi:membrane protein implicated in regulation of membrane protease activity